MKLTHTVLLAAMAFGLPATAFAATSAIAVGVVAGGVVVENNAEAEESTVETFNINTFINSLNAGLTEAQVKAKVTAAIALATAGLSTDAAADKAADIISAAVTVFPEHAFAIETAGVATGKINQADVALALIDGLQNVDATAAGATVAKTTLTRVETRGSASPGA